MENNQEENTFYKEVDVRKQKIAELREQGVIVYADKFNRTHKISEAIASWGKGESLWSSDCKACDGEVFIFKNFRRGRCYST